ncbi:DEAD/DEAH box helicase [Bdellovibrio sp. NC01]|uniref:DEAD/DEAH box helicase n=1 Tax=Bdellovibrio sp. NC01 TaxID=2220073 RepID=UPI001159C6BB|nr:DEAD/DEAH box helicase [Bdellovibrio sp. NC01]QDK36361.1 ATP-dependent helicase [Bdellovibrio sp. NC01]
MKTQSSTLHHNRFQDMNLAPELLTALSKMNISKPTQIQSQAIPVAMEGHDLIAIAQTGSGKTLAYALATLTRLKNKPEARALVLSPSREMAQQVYKVLIELVKELPMSVALVVGGAAGSKQDNQLKKNPKIIVATPGRMIDHLTGNKLLLQGVETVIIDEADRMLDMGFAPQLRAIQNTMRGEIQTLMFSASFGKNVEEIAQVFIKYKPFMIKTSEAEAPVSALKQKVLFMDRSMKNDRILDDLNATRGGVIVFTGNQESCEALGNYLKEYGYATDLIHGGLSQGQRNRVVRDFRSGELRVVVATDLLARGLDVPHVDHVINFDLPFQAEDFLHRIGRTARAGRGGEALTYVTPSDTRMYHKIKTYLVGAEEIKIDPMFKFIDRSRKFGHKKKALSDQRAASAPQGRSLKGGKPSHSGGGRPQAGKSKSGFKKK